MSAIFVTDESKYSNELQILKDKSYLFDMNPLFFGKSPMVRVYLKHDNDDSLQSLIGKIEYTPFVRQLVLPYDENREELELAILQKAINLEDNPLSLAKDIVDEKNIVVTYYLKPAIPFYIHPSEWEVYSSYLDLRNDDLLVSADSLFGHALDKFPSSNVYKHPQFDIWYQDRNEKLPENALEYLEEMKSEEFFLLPREVDKDLLLRMKDDFELIDLPDSDGLIVAPKPGLLINASWMVDNSERIKKGDLPQVILNLEQFSPDKKMITEEELIDAVENVAERENLPQMLSDLSLNYPYLWMRAPTLEIVRQVVDTL